MKLKIFSIFDVKAEAYLPPFFLPTVGMATRAFKDCVNQQGHQFCENPGDYTLFELGEFDDVKGEIQTRAAHKSLGNGLTYKLPKDASPGQLMSDGVARLEERLALRDEQKEAAQ